MSTLSTTKASLKQSPQIVLTMTAAAALLGDQWVSSQRCSTLYSDCGWRHCGSSLCEHWWLSARVSQIGSLLLLCRPVLVSRLKVWLTSRHPQTSTVCQKKSRVYPCLRRRLVQTQRFPIILPAELDSSSYRKCWAEHNPRRHQTRLPPCPEAPVISLSLLCVKWKM